jgi:L-arabinokinase
MSIDTVTKIEAQKLYKPAVCGRHPVYENSRVIEFKTLMKNFRTEKDKHRALIKMGNLMMQSHESYSAVGLGNEHTDMILELVREAGAARGVFGARVSGGGNGGTVCVLSYGNEGKSTVKEIYQKYKHIKRQRLFFFSGSSHGAYALNQYI